MKSCGIAFGDGFFILGARRDSGEDGGLMLVGGLTPRRVGGLKGRVRVGAVLVVVGLRLALLVRRDGRFARNDWRAVLARKIARPVTEMLKRAKMVR